MKLLIVTNLLVQKLLAGALRPSSKQSLRVYIYPVSVRDFDIDAEAVERYERWLDTSVVQAPHNITGVKRDIEHNHVLHSPRVGIAATVENFGLRVWKPEHANVFWLPISNVMLCLATYKAHDTRNQPIGKAAYTCKAYLSILQWLFQQDSWRRNEGSDHVFDIDQVPLHGNATNAMLDRAFAKSIIITTEDRGGEAVRKIRARREIIVPYFVDRQTYFVDPMPQKTALVSFVGSGAAECHVMNCSTWNSYAIRKRIMGEFRNAKDVALVDLGGDRLLSSFDSSVARDVYAKSIFCVVPAGDSFTSARLFAVLMSTCIPVKVNDHVQLPFEDSLPMKWDDFSVKLKETDVLRYGVLGSLRELAEDEVLIAKMQRAGRKARHLLSYTSTLPSDRTSPDNAQAVILEEIAHRVGVEWRPQRSSRQLSWVGGLADWWAEDVLRITE